MLDLFLESFWLGEDTRPLLDQTAYDRCMFKRLHCYRLVTEGVDFGEEKVFMSRDFIKMMWRRTFLLMEVLRRGYSFILQVGELVLLYRTTWMRYLLSTEFLLVCEYLGEWRSRN